MHTSETMTLDELIACRKELTAEEKPSGGFGVLAIQGGRIIILLKHEAEALLETVEAMRDDNLTEMAERGTYRERDSIQAFCRAAVRLHRRLGGRRGLLDQYLAKLLWNYSHGVFGIDEAAGWADDFLQDVAKSREIADRLESLKSKDLERLMQWINRLDLDEAQGGSGQAENASSSSEEVGQ